LPKGDIITLPPQILQKKSRNKKTFRGCVFVARDHQKDIRALSPDFRAVPAQLKRRTQN
jgi:hypothetical protein